jgi:uncharacterized membrane protein YraQ (UPF0718 family)
MRISGIREWRALALVAGGFLACYFLPVGHTRFDQAILEAFHLVKWYAREHVLMCLIPAFFIAGAISIFVSQAAVMRYLGPQAKKLLAFGVASVSGAVLAVCSCTILPLFAGIYRMGAGLGPASTFLYAGPAINVLAIILTSRILGFQLGAARAIGAVLFSILIGLIMHLIFRRAETAKQEAAAALPEPEAKRPLWQNALFFAALVAVLVFANWGRPEDSAGIWYAVFTAKWILTALAGAALGLMLVLWFGLTYLRVLCAAAPLVLLAALFPGRPILPFAAGVIGLTLLTGTHAGETREWLGASWGFAKQILPLLFLGVLIAGVLLGRPDHEGAIPASWISRHVGGNSLGANLFASVAGALMYFATLTEVPILQGLMGSGMGKGPALALLLAGPALSLPNMLVIRSVMGVRRTAAFVVLVVLMATASGMIYGTLF